MASYAWGIWQMSRKKTLLKSEPKKNTMAYGALILILSNYRQRREHRVFSMLLQMVPGLENRLMNGEDEDVVSIAEMVRSIYSGINLYNPPLIIPPGVLLQLQKGVSSARSDDTKSLKGPVLDWIVPPGQSLTPPLARNVKMDRGYHHERTGSLLCPAGMDWNNTE